MAASNFFADEPSGSQYRVDGEPWCEIEVDGVTREGYVRAWSARPHADPPGWWAFIEWHDEKGYNRISWFHESAVTDMPKR